MITRLVGFDLETTGVDVATCEVVQAAYIDTLVDPKCWACRGEGGSFEQGPAHTDYWELCSECGGKKVQPPKKATVLCRSRQPIPLGATRVHGLYDERSNLRAEDIEPEWASIPEDAAHFSGYAGQLFDFAEQDSTALVTFNGLRFDVPIWERIAGQPNQPRKLRVPHIDVFRLHLHAKAAETECQHVEGRWPASVFAGSLQAAHVFWTGRTFEGAHDALVDVRATLDVLQAMLDYPHPMAGGYTLERAVELTSTPLPGDVDLDGKFSWSGDDVVITIGKVKGLSIRDREVEGFMRWMLKKDFSEDTKAICRAALRGEYPRRET